MKVSIVKKGGTGSGHHGHSGRPGEVGGSLPGSGGFGSLSEGGVDENTLSMKALDTFLNGGALSKDSNWQRGDWDRDVRVKMQTMRDLAVRSGLSNEECKFMIAQWAQSSNDTDMRSLALQVDASEELGIELSIWQQLNLADVQRERDTFIEDGLRTKGFDSLDDAYEGYKNVWRIEYETDYEDYKLVVQREIIRNSRYIEEPEAKYVPLYSSETQRKFIRAMYENTQERLGAYAGDTVELYRGVKNSDMESGIARYYGNAIESWSMSKIVTRDFAREDGDVILQAVVPIKNIVGTARTGFGCLMEGEFVIIPGNDAIVSVENIRSAHHYY